MTFTNGTTALLGSIREVTVWEPPVKTRYELAVRTPTVDVNGSLVLANLKTIVVPSFTNIRESPKATFAGRISFSLPLSDKYSFLTGLRYSGGVSYPKPPAVWNEAGPLLGISPELVAAGLLLLWWFYFRRPSRRGAAGPSAPQAGTEGPAQA